MRAGVVASERARGRKALATGSEFELRNPHPLAASLPGVYRDAWIDEQRRTAREPFGTRFISALDTVLAPVLATLDNLDAYLDPDTTPEDFLGWLGEWVAASVDAGWPEDRRRAFVGQAAELYRRRGTAAGLRDHVQIHTGGEVEIVENGASSWSAKPDGKLPGSPEPVVVIRVTVDDPDSIDRIKLEAMVRASKPAHVVHRVEVVGSGQRAGRKGKTPTTEPTPVAEPEPTGDVQPTGEVQPVARTEPTSESEAPSKPAASSKPEPSPEPEAQPEPDAPSDPEAPAT
jgi:phage tail-like protein